MSLHLVIIWLCFKVITFFYLNRTLLVGRSDLIRACISFKSSSLTPSDPYSVFRWAGKHWEMSSPGIGRIRSFIWGAVQWGWSKIPTKARRAWARDATVGMQWSPWSTLGVSRGIKTQDRSWEKIHLQHLRPGLPHQVLPQQAPAPSSQNPEGPRGLRVRVKWGGPLPGLSLLPPTKHVSTGVLWVPDSAVSIRLITGGCRSRSKWNGLWREVTHLLIFCLF